MSLFLIIFIVWVTCLILWMKPTLKISLLVFVLYVIYDINLYLTYGV